ncbi:O-methyltransferase [Irpex lacteus]|nr:O-methyltransferase [Irpex lacteus]
MSATASFPGLQELRALANLINAGVDQLEQVCITQGKDIPPLNEPTTLQEESILFSPDAIKTGSLIVAATTQLAAAVRPSLFAATQLSFSTLVPTSLGIAIKAHVPEILKEAGPKGLHAKDIAKYTGVNSEKLAHILRLLATAHIFKEVAPDTFANNRISSGVDTGKSVKEILADPEAKYDGTQSAAALIEQVTTDDLLNFAHLHTVIFDPKLTNSGEPNESAFNIAHKTDLPVFEWFSQPEQAYQSRRFATGMHAGNRVGTPGIITKGFDWKSLPKGSVVVDVAGGIGTQTAFLAKEFDHLKFIVQDRAPVIENDAPKFWEAELPEAITSGRVQLQVHDIFKPQPVRDAAVFFLRAISHDWSDDYCVKFLTQLREAATPNTQLIVIDNVIPYACADSGPAIDIPGASSIRPTAPPPLLPNFGAGGIMTYLGDIMMLVGHNAHERTVPEFANIFERSGWKLVRVHSEGFNFHDIKIIGVPA